ncbi:MAG: VOC family protein [Gammaproteobacteria bacterium]|nr:VOC family protein [Gammaproteobacteria bacterium]
MTKDNILQYSHVCIEVFDLQQSIDFYHQLLSTRVVHEFRAPNNFLYGVLLLIAPGMFLEVFLSENNYPKQDRSQIIRHFCFQVKSLSSLAKQLKTMNINTEIKRGRTDKTLQLTIQDPDGIEIEFHEYDELCVQAKFL